RGLALYTYAWSSQPSRNKERLDSVPDTSPTTSTAPSQRAPGAYANQCAPDHDHFHGYALPARQLTILAMRMPAELCRASIEPGSGPQAVGPAHAAAFVGSKACASCSKCSDK